MMDSMSVVRVIHIRTLCWNNSVWLKKYLASMIADDATGSLSLKFLRSRLQALLVGGLNFYPSESQVSL
jgi:hypothetical protein